MTDIVERLRWRATNTSTPTATTPMLCDEAADEIEYLRAVLREIVSITDRKHDAWDRAKLLLGGEYE